MALHFSNEEFSQRQHRTIEQLKNRQLDGLLMFRQESMYYLTGYDSFGYVFFQCLYLDADGRLMLMTRAPDLRQAQHTSTIEDIRIWVDRSGSDPAVQLKNILDEFGCKGQRLGVEFDAYGLTAKNGQLLEAALADFCTLEDASDLVSRLRLVKSTAELAYVRQAAELADRVMAEVVPRLRENSLITVLSLADMLARVAGIGAKLDAGEPTLPPALPEALGLGTEDLEAILAEADTIRQKSEAFFRGMAA